ncbi:ATP-grasp domain-containing protein [Flagellimonas halotolerans]|uniref:ATP-grasp domain-containing protein n=1 Tax=Flagellimonas halotolerans TaxID=3112164 RepID=A0ABU6ISA3_9FLAO|nr:MULTISPECIES: ATP-grasp domain-containing protein [unclassified Allomuricauda]MEC3966143.1 ATP-grasp domain-containing protein [Muricauda sp. SYSU M86414]MEC4266008.1 ATP-grasp domain-containing protein [Muricauda sp. SYSU M84420]
MNILFTCAGRRNYLINYFKSALNGHGKVVAVDMQLSAPALVDADIAKVVPSIYDENYISSIIAIVEEQNINAIISLNDLELPILAENKEKLETLGVKVLISPESTIDICFDKWKTYHFFKENGINTPLTFINIATAKKALEKNELKFPLIVKPRWGSASIGIDIVHSEEELELSYQLQHLKVSQSILGTVSATDAQNSIMIQEKLNGEEFGVDILNNFEGEFYGSFVRKKLAMRSGETDKAVSVINADYNKVAEKVGRATKHIGNMDCDFFVVDGEVYFLEMNPRFGGGYPFSHEAGINTPAIYLAWLNHESNMDQFNRFKDGLAFSKFDNLMPIPQENI